MFIVIAHRLHYIKEEGYRVYAIDLLGFGASDKPSDVEYSIELWGELLADFVRSKSGEEPNSLSWVIAGNSIGGLCSLLVSATIPEHISGCVLFNCAGGMTGFRYEELPFVLRPVLYLVQNIVFKGSVGKNFFQNFKTRENVESILKQQGVYVDQRNVNDELLEILLAPSDDEGAEDVFLKVFGGPPGPTPESILPNVKCPILALWGDSDPWTPLDRGMHPGSTFGNYTDNLKLITLPNTGHCPHVSCVKCNPYPSLFLNPCNNFYLFCFYFSHVSFNFRMRDLNCATRLFYLGCDN
jgi:pimeloyl-ACP methyl ester carboxylesterase